MKRARSLGALVALGALGVLAACGVGDFTPVTKLDSVRILASRADKPYAKPGDAVHVEVLTVDQRADRTRPMTLYWIPILCENPPRDTYYECFAGAADGGARDGGAANAGFALLKPGVDLTPFLKTGPSFDFTMPADAIATHPRVAGLDAPYGLVILFNVACAGHLEITQGSPSGGLQQVPLGCFDENHVALDPSQYVIGYTRVYAYDARTNANPVIEKARFEGATGGFVDLDPTSPPVTTVDHCTDNCPDLKFDVVIPADSWELNPSDKDQNGNVRHEQIWADYYTTLGDLQGGARLLYDPAVGAISGTEITYHAPSAPGDGALFVVVHDNRGGANWITLPLHVQ